MKNKTPDVYIDFEEEIPEEFVFNCVSDFYIDDLNLALRKREKEAYSAFEWIYPTAIIAYILKPYFEGLLSELSKDHYQLLKKGLKKMVSSGKLVESQLVSATKSTEKLSPTYNQSLMFSLVIQIKDGKQIKLLFDNSLDKSDWDEAINQLLDFAIEHYEKNDDKLSKLIVDANPKNNSLIYAKINLESKEIEFYDDQKLIEYYKR